MRMGLWSWVSCHHADGLESGGFKLCTGSSKPKAPQPGKRSLSVQAAPEAVTAPALRSPAGLQEVLEARVSAPSHHGLGFRV